MAAVERVARGRTRSADVEQALLEAAEAVLAREGLSGVTVRAVAAEAGVAPMGVYNRFGSKDGLIAALVMRSFDLLREAVADHGETDPAERLRGAGLRYREFALSHPQHYAVIFLNRPGVAGRDDPEVEQHARAAFEALVAHVVYGMAQGTVRPGDPVDLAQQIWSAVHGAVALELGEMVLTDDPQVTYEHLLELVLTGISAGISAGVSPVP